MAGIDAYISRSKAKEILVALLIESALNNVGFHADASDVFEDIAKNRLDTWLNLVPKKDAVEVVRCKDCKHDNSNDQICPIPWVKRTLDTFCSFGERRADNG